MGINGISTHFSFASLSSRQVGPARDGSVIVAFGIMRAHYLKNTTTIVKLLLINRALLFLFSIHKYTMFLIQGVFDFFCSVRVLGHTIINHIAGGSTVNSSPETKTYAYLLLAAT